MSTINKVAVHVVGGSGGAFVLILVGQTGLDQTLAGLAREYGLQLLCCVRVNVTSLAGDQQHHLGTGQRRQLIGLVRRDRISISRLVNEI